MENPYQSPHELPGQATSVSGGGMARQIPVVAVLLMVQGGLELAVGGLWGLAGGTFAVLTTRQAQQGDPNVPLSPQTFGWMMGAVYALMALATFVVAALKLFAGWRNYSFRGRTWGIAALASGVISIVSCYCFPTALALMIYGLIVYLNSEARWAFSMGEQGLTREQVLWHLQRDTSL
ncbi:MAG TPA: hypothetical protein VG826_02900 [Pirellulales bacterium]|nr:hypothetical protein [Pirellulales bacterium]